MLAGANAFAQVGVGYVNSSLSSKIGNVSETTSTNGLYLGGHFNIPIAGGLGIAPGLYWEYLSGENGSTVVTKTNEHYLSVPVMFNYSYPVSNAFSVFAYAGPGINFGLSSKASATLLGNTTTTDLYKDSDYSRWDITIGGGIGVDILNMIRVEAGYNYGMLDRNTADNMTAHRSEFHVGVAYLF